MDNAHMPRLQSNTRSAELAAPLPDLPLVRRQADCADSSAGPAALRDHAALPRGAGRLDGHGAQRAGDPSPGKAADGAAAAWWGCAFGLRQPEKSETPLSAEEVIHAVFIGVAQEDDDELDTWPMRRRVRLAGTWSLPCRGRLPAQPFDAAFLGRKRA